MAEGKIVRKGGAVGTKAPSINFVSSTFDSITFTITNNDTATADIFWEVGDSTPDANTLSLAGGATSSNQVASGLTEETSYTIFAFANAEGKAGSQTSTNVQTTPVKPINYTAATGGTTAEYDSGGKRYKSHTFTSNGTFTVTSVGDTDGDRNKIEYVIVAGGGAAGSASYSGGGGAGGYRSSVVGELSGRNTSSLSKVTVIAQSYSIVIGAGGNNSNGSNSSAFGITSNGGGQSPGGNAVVGLSGGSGGAGSLPNTAGINIAGGSGTAGQGFDGGETARLATGGGGGAGANGASATSQATNAAAPGGNGGDGIATAIRTGVAEYYAGGGGGLGWSGQSGGTGGLGGGGNGASNISSGSQSGAVNTGGGGGAGATGGRLGGSGIVIVRYEIAPSV